MRRRGGAAAPGRRRQGPRRQGRASRPTRRSASSASTTPAARAPAQIDPIFGREREIRQIIDILARRRKNNPIIVGDSGVGKTALVEGLALMIVQQRGAAAPPEHATSWASTSACSRPARA